MSKRSFHRRQHITAFWCITTGGLAEKAKARRQSLSSLRLIRISICLAGSRSQVSTAARICPTDARNSARHCRNLGLEATLRAYLTHLRIAPQAASKRPHLRWTELTDSLRRFLIFGKTVADQETNEFAEHDEVEQRNRHIERPTVQQIDKVARNEA